MATSKSASSSSSKSSTPAPTLAPPSLSQVLAQNVAANSSASSTPSAPSSSSSPSISTGNVNKNVYTDPSSGVVIGGQSSKYTAGSMPYYMELTGGNVAKSQQLTSDYARTGLDPYRTFTAPDGSTYNGLTNTGTGIYSGAGGGGGINKTISFSAKEPVDTSITLGGGKSTNTGTSTTPRVQIGNYVSSFRNALGNSSTRDDYNKTINYDTLTNQQKKIADRMFDVANKQGKLKPIDIYDTRQKTLEEEKKKTQDYYDAEVARQKKAEEDALASDKANIDQQTGEISALRDEYVANEEARLKDTETNRLNQVRGNIMQVLAQRGVDISKLSPEQIVALSGEQGAKAFMDIADARDAAKAKIENAKQNALIKLNELRNAKALSEKTYAKNIASIKSQAEAAKLSADQNASSQIFAIATTKDQQARQDSTQRVNAVTNMASTLGLSGSQIAPLLKLIDTKGYGPQQVQAIANMLSDPNSEISKSVAANMTAAQKAALLKAQIELQDSNAKLITANAAMVRANKTGRSGSYTDIQNELAAFQANKGTGN